MSAVQLLVCLFGLVMVYLSYLGFRRRQFGAGGLSLWLVIWIGLVVVTLVPQVFRPLVQPLRVARLMDLVVILGMLALGAITYRTYAIVQQLRHQLEKAVREEALAGLQIKDEDSPAGPAG
jgi:hypothetical protein